MPRPRQAPEIRDRGGRGGGQGPRHAGRQQRRAGHCRLCRPVLRRRSGWGKLILVDFAHFRHGLRK